ncbi:hypothetical protein NG54_07950 [Heyndrickxia ginsengihumi]|uniref:Uncharacterized protein n=1 Tax=Heyndrickxia ginsengihumi TaxID=363870 RepID=A0A0A6VBS3_9BACI|nr:hypothetical protein [Heyndrickxia ginsengihumi]KHD85685.1 hypothetical protein NG54_07950 [Heyndrickxia ginsengihumi]
MALATDIIAFQIVEKNAFKLFQTLLATLFIPFHRVAKNVAIGCQIGAVIATITFHAAIKREEMTVHAALITSFTNKK